jgi:hypothetical protein
MCVCVHRALTPEVKRAPPVICPCAGQDTTLWSSYKSSQAACGSLELAGHAVLSVEFAEQSVELRGTLKDRTAQLGLSHGVRFSTHRLVLNIRG